MRVKLGLMLEDLWGHVLIKRWPKRRELLCYYLLWRTFGDRVFNLGEAVEVLAPLLGSKRVATRLVKRLVKQGFLVRIAPLTYRARDLVELLDDAAAVYFAKRLRRRGVDASAVNGRLVVNECVEGLERVPLVEVHCSSSS